MKSEETIGARLKRWRQALGLTQAQFCERLGMHIGVLKKYEQDVNVPGGEVLAAIAKTGCNINWLLTGEGEMLPETRVSAEENASQYARRWEKIIALVEGIEDEQERAAFIDELYARARQTAELAELRKAVRELSAAIKKMA